MLTISVSNGTKVLCNDVHMLDLTFKAEGGDCQVKASSQLYVLDGLQSNVILGMDS